MISEFAGKLTDAVLVAMAAGTFIYVGATEVIAEEFESPHDKWKKFFALSSEVLRSIVLDGRRFSRVYVKIFDGFGWKIYFALSSEGFWSFLRDACVWNRSMYCSGERCWNLRRYGAVVMPMAMF